jgi:glycosyltransferase involved in cell wall biosynthesis
MPSADILHCFSHRYYLFMGADKPKTILHMHTPEVPLLWEIAEDSEHRRERERFLKEKLESFERWVKVKNQGTDLIIACSNFVAEKAKSVFPGVPVKRVYNFVLLKEFGEACYSGGDFILYAGALVPEKGVDVLLEAAKLLGERGCGVPVYLLGSSKLWLSDYEDEARRRYAGLANVRFLGQRKHAEVVGFMRNAAVGVVPSVNPEAFGLVAAEFMACGIPVVATNVGGLPEVVKDGETGVLVPPGDPEALAEKIMWLLKNPSTRRKMGAAGRRRVEALFSGDLISKKYLKLYSNILRQGGRGNLA